ncbi:MAG: alpha/beta fold hydrolase [Bacteroidota bacterium]
MKKIAFSIIFLLLVNCMCFPQTVKTIQHGGLTRDYIEYVPSIYNGSEPVPILICLHGLGDNMSNFTSIGMHDVADTANFIVITPQALMATVYTYQVGTAWNSGVSYSGIVLNQNIDDMGFIRALIDTTMILYHIDTNRIYVTGFSMGGFMCNRLACEMNDVFAAIASVSGTLGNTIVCNPPAPIPVCHFHGTADGTVSYTGNQYGNDAEVLVEYWRNYNNCDSIPVIDSMPDIVSDGLQFVKFTYANGDDNSEVLFYKVLNGDHNWYYYPNNDITYTIEIWNFLKKFSKNSLSSIVELKKSSINIFPNPANGFVNIELPESFKNSTVTIYSITGENIVSLIPENQKISISLENFDPGIYFLHYQNQNVSITDKIVIISNNY